MRLERWVGKRDFSVVPAETKSESEPDFLGKHPSRASNQSDSKEIERSLTRISHEIIEQNSDLNTIAIVGIRTRGEYIAQRIKLLVEKFANTKVANGILDVTFHRDDYRTNLGSPKVGISKIEFDVEGKDIIIVDDVLYTGRTIRAAMDEIFSYGRPASVQLAILVDRGHKELPIRADYVGKNYPTSINQHIHVHIDEVDNIDEIILIEYIE